MAVRHENDIIIVVLGKAKIPVWSNTIRQSVASDTSNKAIRSAETIVGFGFGIQHRCSMKAKLDLKYYPSDPNVPGVQTQEMWAEGLTFEELEEYLND